MLIGAEYFWELLESDRIELGPNLPTLTNTKLGWIAGGVIASDEPVVAHTFCQTAEDEPLIELLRSSYNVEACDEIRLSPKADDERCLEHFRRTHRRTEEGRYVVQHFFNERRHELGDPRSIALWRYLNLEGKLDMQPELKEQYSQFIREYELLGHMRVVQEDSLEKHNSVFYLPNHCVQAPSSTTTKLRVVFDGSAKSSSGVSINDVLMTGPTIQNDLIAILLRFRGCQYVFIHIEHSQNVSPGRRALRRHKISAYFLALQSRGTFDHSRAHNSYVWAGTITVSSHHGAQADR